MTAIQLPKNWTPAQAHAAITLMEAVLDALWRQYPEPDEQYLHCDFNDDDSYDPPLNACEQSTNDEEINSGFSSDVIPF